MTTTSLTKTLQSTPATGTTRVRINGIGAVVPHATFSQQQILEFLLDSLNIKPATRVLYKKTFAHPSIETRHFALTHLKEALEVDHDKINQRFEEQTAALATRALDSVLQKTARNAREIDFIVAATCTGYVCPGLTSHLIERGGLRRDVRAADIVGMGCGAAIPALEQAHNFIKAHPGAHAAVVCAEVCSAAMFSNDDPDIVISNTLFADGAAAAILSSDPARPEVGAALHPRILNFASLTIPKWRESLRFKTEDGHLRNTLSREVPQQAGQALKETVAMLLAGAGRSHFGVARWVMHAGGDKILNEIQRTLNLRPTDLDSARDVLRRYGNMSSPTVLFVLNEECAARPPRPGEIAVMASFGAGFSAHAVLLEF